VIIIILRPHRTRK